MKNPMIDFDIEFDTVDYAIGGKMIVGQATVPEMYIMQAKNDVDLYNDIRRMLVNKLVDAILERQLVEITQLKDPMNLDTKLYVRAYLAPNDQIKILRTMKT